MANNNENDENSSDGENEIDTLYVTKLQPFDLAFVDGFDHKNGLRYYENKLNESCLVYTMSNIITIFRLETGTTTNITGHEMKIIEIQIDKNYKIMMSCDVDSVFLWDLKNDEKLEPVLLRTIYKPFESTNILRAGLSSCGKYLLIASDKISKTNDENFKSLTRKFYDLQFWEWSFGRSECDDSTEIESNYNDGSLIDIKFNMNENEEKCFLITFSKIVIFGAVLYQNKKIILYHPKFTATQKINETIFIENSRLAISCCNKGVLVLWNDNTMCEANENEPDKCLHEKAFYKSLTFRDSDINNIKMFGNYIVTADSMGDVKFYDDNLLLLYIYKLENNKDIKYINILSVCQEGSKIKNDEGNWPTDLSRKKETFRVQNFFLVTYTGEVYYADVRKSVCLKTEIESTYSLHTVIYYTKPWFLCCFENGLVVITNYKTKRDILSLNILDRYGDIPRPYIVTCQISDDEKFVGISLSKGLLWILDALTFEPTHQRKILLRQVATNIIFGPHHLCATTDNDNNLNMFKYDGKGDWSRILQVRSHSDTIINVFYLLRENEKYIVSIGADRMYIKLKITASDIGLEFQKRLEQVPKITAAVIYPAKSLGMDYDNEIIITANDLYKFVFFDAHTADKLYTFLGPIFETPIQKILLINDRNHYRNSYLVVCSCKTLGIIILPMDGNPYRHSGIVAHHTKIDKIRSSFDGKYVILFGKADSGGYFWKINEKNIEKNLTSGGEELEPFCRLLPGGKSGWLFHQIQNYFIYFQLLVNTQDTSEQTSISEYMKIADLPDYMRSLGFFPSEFEIKDFIDEVTKTKYAWQQRPRDIKFTDVVKLYINHKPLDGYSLSDILTAVQVINFTKTLFAIVETQDNTVNCEKLVSVLTDELGDNISEEQAQKYIVELLEPQKLTLLKRCAEIDTEIDKKYNYENIRNMTFTPLTFCQNILGLNARTTCRTETEDEEIILDEAVKLQRPPRFDTENLQSHDSGNLDDIKLE